MIEHNQHQPGQPGDLQQVRGIGKSVAQTLNSVGIHHCTDLADYSNAELAKLLKDKLPAISLSSIERDDWCGQARQIASNAAETASSPLEEEQPPEQMEAVSAFASEQPALSNHGLKENSSTARSDSPGNRSWDEVADFFVSFGYQVKEPTREQLYTKIYHSQSGVSQVWEGLVRDELIEWMLSRMEEADTEQVPSEYPAPVDREEQTEVLAEAETVDEIEAAEEDIVDQEEEGVEVEEAFVQSELAEAAFGGEMEQMDTGDSEQPVELRLELHNLNVSEVKVPVAISNEEKAVVLRVDGQLALSGTQSHSTSYEYPRYHIDMYLVNLETNASNLAGEITGLFSPDVLFAPVHEDIRIYEVGDYQLYFMLRLQPPHSAVTHMQGPLIHIQP